MTVISFILGFIFALVLVHFYPKLGTVGAAVVKTCKALWAKVRGKTGE